MKVGIPTQAFPQTGQSLPAVSENSLNIQSSQLKHNSLLTSFKLSLQELCIMNLAHQPLGAGSNWPVDIRVHKDWVPGSVWETAGSLCQPMAIGDGSKAELAVSFKPAFAFNSSPIKINKGDFVDLSILRTMGQNVGQPHVSMNGWQTWWADNLLSRFQSISCEGCS